MPGINLQGETEQSLMAALQQGRQEVLGLLYDAYAPVMLGVISRIVPDQHMAEEVLQETFVAIWSRIKVYDASKGRFLIWGLAIARGIALETLKRGNYQQMAEGPSAPDTEGAAKPQANMWVEAKQLPCHLEPQEREALELIYLKGCTCTEAAAQLGITIETLRLRIKKAFQHLRAEHSA
ncbi:sigma-70 family RNA polymerase sigma factor [Pontibacter sp. E15-1]|uniref:RNA polymerase sigma factor n=1 Tax=Pontibacter sp. E15-1 TaxID=2919918 RepID=UPI001F4F30FF|nr:sigma-70 family RNA polymerase sigma factor [Pontibacter sp. E15-1]MCJ8164177.1 sigma-70 family RNA polymerase sigma factor [Pontibacter sp. E15-1]